MFDAIQSKIIVGIGVLAIILSQRERYNFSALITQVLLYFAVAYNADCLVSGRCEWWAWGSVLLPLIQTIGFLFFAKELDIRPPVAIPRPRVMKDQE